VQHEFPGSQEEVKDQDWIVSSLVRNLCSRLELSNNRRDCAQGCTPGTISEEICALDGATRGAVSEATRLG